MQQKYYKLIARKCQGKREGCSRDVATGGGGEKEGVLSGIQHYLQPWARNSRESQTTNFEPIVWLWQCVCVCLVCVCVWYECVCVCVCLLWCVFANSHAMSAATGVENNYTCWFIECRPTKTEVYPPPFSSCPTPLLPCLLPSAGCCKWAATLRLQRRHIVTVPRHHLRSPQQLVEIGKRKRTDKGQEARGAKGDKRKADWF